MSDQDLIQGCVLNNRRAKEAFVTRFLPIIYGSIKNQTRNHFSKYGKSVSSGEYEDLVQELSHDVVISLFENDCKALRAFEGKGGCPLEGYIGTIAIRKAIDYWRSIKNVASFQEGEASELGQGKEMTDALVDPYAYDALKDWMNRQQVEVLLKHLNEEEQGLCHRLFVDDLSFEQIAKELGITVDHLYVRKQRLLKKLKEIALEHRLC